MEEDNLPIPEDASELEFLEQEAKEKIFIESEDLPINEDVLKQQVGARQLGFGDDELEIIEGTAFKEIMDDMDAKDIHYSDVDIYSYIPESERLTPYLIFMEDARNRWYTDEFVNYLVKVSATGAFETMGYNDLPFSPAAQIHEHALNISFRRGPDKFWNILSNVILDTDNPMGGLNPRKMKIKYINNIFPGGSYKATLEEENRKFWEEKGMTPEGEWLPEIAEKGIIRMVDADGNVTYENFKGEPIPDDDPRLEKYKFDDITQKMKTEAFNEAEGPEKWKMMRDENIITEYQYQELLKGNDPFTFETDTPTNVVDDISELDEFAFKESIAYKRSQTIKESIRGDEFNPFGDYRNRIVANNLIDLYTEYDSFVLNNNLNFKEQELLLSYVNSEVMNVSGELANLQSKPDVDLSSEELEKLNDILDKAKKDFKGKLEIELSSIKGVPDNISELADTPTNVVDEGVELYHSISKGETVNKNFHAGTYNAALDRASQFYGGEQLYKIANDNLDFIQEQANDLVSELSEKVSFENVDDMFQITNDSVTREVSITLPTGNEARFNIVAETFDNTLTVKFQDVDGYDGGQIYSQELIDIDYEPDDLKTFVGEIDEIVDDETIANNLLDEIGLKSQAGEFNYKDGYDLYKVNIKPGANVVNIPDTAIFIENGIEKEMSSDFIQGFIERPKEVNRFTDVTQIIIDGKTYDITDTFTSSQALQEHFKDADVLVYTNDIEDVGSKSYMFLNENSYVLEKIDDAQFNIDVANKYIKNNPYETISKLARREAFTEPERYQVLLNALLDETDTPATTGPPELETRIKVSTQNPEDFGVPGNVEDYKEIEGWADDVIKPNKIFNPDAMTRIESSTIGQRYIWNDTTEFKPSEMYSRIITNNATDEDITRFFIYLATHSEQPAYAMKSFKQPDALADIVKIGIFSDRPITDIIPIGVHLQETIFIGNLRNSNSQIGDEINKVLVDLVLERGQFTNLRETMRNVILEAHNDIYRQNPNDYFVLWRGGDLHRFHPWQSFTKHPSAAQDIANQMDMMYGAGTEVKSYIINKNNMIDLDALGLSFNDENEIIVLTEAANKPNATVVNIQTPEDLQNAYRTFQKNVANNDFPKQGFEIQNISKPLADAGQESQEFFSDVIKGMDDRYRPRKAYNPIIELNHPDLQSTIDIYNKNVLNGGDFNQHIFTSIPTFYETQIVKAKALENMLRNAIDPTAPDIRILDIGATEGVWAKTITTEYPQVFVNIIEPNPAAKEIFEKEFSDRVMFTQEAFSHYEKDRTRFFSETGKPIKYFTPSENFKYDVVHESMTFQFIDSDRKGQVEYIKNNILKEDGILFIEEKFFSDDAVYKANEELKDKFKLQYYTPEQLETKAIEVLHGMGTKQIPVKDMENILNNNFKYVEQYWDAGNFKGYIASDNELATQFVPEIKKLRTSLTNHIYSTAPTEQEIKASIQKQVQDRGVNRELNKQLTKELTEKNKEFIGKASDAVQTIFKNVKSVGGVGLALGLKGLSKAAPVLEPGDVLIEKAIEKFSPQLNKAAQKLGFASLPVDKILPVYVALEIGIAAAEAVQAAMYAYDETAKKKKGGYIYEYKNIDGKTRYVPLRDEDGEPIFQPAFNTYDFYNTPAGQEVAKEFDFGSNFLRQLEQERVSRYSPGWNLSKAIFGLFGTMGDAQANISEQTRGNMGQALLTGIGK